jgi:FkbM family methyltransferase
VVSLNRWLEKRRNPWKAPFFDAFGKWRREDGQSHLSDYAALPDDALVFDIGGFRGEWTDTVRSKCPGAQVHVFEPHPVFAASLRQKYDRTGGVNVHEFALGANAGSLTLSDAGDASSAVADHDRAFDAPVVALRDFFDRHNISRVDLVKMNIEGGEYDLLPALIEVGLIERIARLQVQFHLFDPALIARRDAIRAQLQQTHDCTWCYSFVWEEWQLHSNSAEKV